MLKSIGRFHRQKIWAGAQLRADRATARSIAPWLGRSLKLSVSGRCGLGEETSGGHGAVGFPLGRQEAWPWTVPLSDREHSHGRRGAPRRVTCPATLRAGMRPRGASLHPAAGRASSKRGAGRHPESFRPQTETSRFHFPRKPHGHGYGRWPISLWPRTERPISAVCERRTDVSNGFLGWRCRTAF